MGSWTARADSCSKVLHVVGGRNPPLCVLGSGSLSAHGMDKQRSRLGLVFRVRLQLSTLFCFLDIGITLGFHVAGRWPTALGLHSPRLAVGERVFMSLCGLENPGSLPHYPAHAQVSGGWRGLGLSLQPTEAG